MKLGITKTEYENLRSSGLSREEIIQKHSGKQGVHGVARGFTKGIVSSGLNAVSSIGRNIQRGLSTTVDKVAGTKDFGMGEDSIFDRESTAGTQLRQSLKPKSTAEKIGFYGEQIGEFFVPPMLLGKANVALKASSAPDVLKILGRASMEAGGAGVVAANQTEDAKQGRQAAAFSGALSVTGGVFGKLLKTPAGEKVVSYLTKQIPSDRVNKIIFPRDKDFLFGKNPGLSVLEEPELLGVVKGPITRAQLLTKIGRAKQAVGEEIEAALSKVDPKKAVDLQKAILEPIDEALDRATQSGEQALVDRLVGLRQSLTQEFKLVDGKVVPVAERSLTVNPKKAQEMKITLGQNTRWTGQAFDDDVNRVRVAIYRNIDRTIDDAVPGIDKLNDRYGGLLTAEKALERRNKQLQRLVSFGLRQTGIGGAVGLGSYVSGDSPLEATAKGIAGSVAFGAMASPAVQLRVAKLFNNLAPTERETLFSIVPTLRNMYLALRTDRKSETAADDDDEDEGHMNTQ